MSQIQCMQRNMHTVFYVLYCNGNFIRCFVYKWIMSSIFGKPSLALGKRCRSGNCKASSISSTKCQNVKAVVLPNPFKLGCKWYYGVLIPYIGDNLYKGWYSLWRPNNRDLLSIQGHDNYVQPIAILAPIGVNRMAAILQSISQYQFCTQLAPHTRQPITSTNAD